MARTDAGNVLTYEHRQGQLAIRAQALRDFTTLWPLWHGDKKSFGDLVAATVPLIRSYHGLSGTYAAAYFEAFRKAEEAAGVSPVVAADPINEDQIVASMFVTGDVMTRHALLAGQQPAQAMATALVRTSGAVSRHILEGARETVIRSTARDRQARGWIRVTSGSPCPFCEMLASRGAVYSESSADFKAHDHCGCFAEPDFF